MQAKERGTLKVVAGPMFAGKTTELQRIVRKYLQRGPHSVVALKASFDHRYKEDRIVNHDEAHTGGEDLGIEALCVDPNTVNLQALMTPMTLLIAIDETNFFSPEVLIPQLQQVLAQGIDVVVAGLLYDSNRNPFGATGALLEIADETIVRTAPCVHCGEPARHTERFAGGTDQINVGGADMYRPCCDDCWGINEEL